jgi:DNA-binding NarL/FixJ family response regulator
MRILIADDNLQVRRGVAAILTGENWEVCGEASDGREVIDKARTLLPDFILLDVRMPGLNGLEIAEQLRKEMPASKILIMSQYDPGHLQPRALAAGADACIDKAQLGSELVATIRRLSS